MAIVVDLKVNDRPHSLVVDDDELLCDTLRDRLDLTGTKVACREGVCGSCDVLIGSDVVRSCLILTAQAESVPIRTVEGLGDQNVMSALQASFVENGAVQCGFCTAGMLIAATAAIEADPRRAETDVIDALAGNICRCTGYSKVVDAVVAAARELQWQPGAEQVDR